VYECTTPRGPVAAMFTGPGPSYGLPGLTGRSNHDPCSRFAKAPAYHFGSRSLGEEQTAGPGPCYMPQPKVRAEIELPRRFLRVAYVSVIMRHT